MFDSTNKVEANSSNVAKNYVPTVGKNIHSSPIDGKLLCSYSDKICMQRRLNGYAFCIRHILQDKNAPFKRCQYVARYNGIQCTNAVPISENRLYCNSHMQVLGLVPKRIKSSVLSNGSNNEQDQRPKSMDISESSPNANKIKIADISKTNKKTEDTNLNIQLAKKNPVSGPVRESNFISNYEKSQSYWSWYDSLENSANIIDVNYDNPSNWSYLSKKWQVTLSFPDFFTTEKNYSSNGAIDFQIIETKMINNLKEQLFQLEISNRSLNYSLKKVYLDAKNLLNTLTKNDGLCILNRSSHKRSCRASRDALPCFLAPFPCCGYCQNHMKNDKEQVLFTSCTIKTNRGAICSQILFNYKSDNPVCYKHFNDKPNVDFISPNDQNETINKEKKRKITSSSYTTVFMNNKKIDKSENDYVKVHQVTPSYKQIGGKTMFDSHSKNPIEVKAFPSNYSNVLPETHLVYQQNIPDNPSLSSSNKFSQNNLNMKQNVPILNTEKSFKNSTLINKSDSNHISSQKNIENFTDDVEHHDGLLNRPTNSQENYLSIAANSENSFSSTDPKNFCGYYHQYDVKNYKQSANWNNNSIHNKAVENNYSDGLTVNIDYNNVSTNDAHIKRGNSVNTPVNKYIDSRLIRSIPIQNIIMIQPNNQKVNGLQIEPSIFNDSDPLINKQNVNYVISSRPPVGSSMDLTVPLNNKPTQSFNMNYNSISQSIGHVSNQNSIWSNPVWSNEIPFQSNIPLQYMVNAQNSQKYIVHNLENFPNVEEVSKINDVTLTGSNCSSPYNQKEATGFDRSASSEFFVPSNVFHQTTQPSHLHYQQSLSPVNLYQIIKKNSLISNSTINQSQEPMNVDQSAKNDNVAKISPSSTHQSFQI